VWRGENRETKRLFCFPALDLQGVWCVSDLARGFASAEEQGLQIS
jgi:hypothetical protein